MIAAQEENDRLKRNAGDTFTAKDRPEDVARVLFEMFSGSKLDMIVKELEALRRKQEGLEQEAKSRIKKHVARPRKTTAPANLRGDA